MKIAIIGAGLAGLACAHELERYGIYSTIYEKTDAIGDPYNHSSAILRVLHPQTGNILAYNKNKLHLDIKPICQVNRLYHVSPTNTSIIRGNFGYLFLRGKFANSIKNQIAQSLKKTHIIFNYYADYTKLKKDNDYVVISTGNPFITDELGLWTKWLTAYCKGAVVLGNFNPTTIKMWINKEYCKNGYAYLTPLSNKHASIVLMVPEINEEELDNYWEIFWYRENFRYEIIKEFKVLHNSGFSFSATFENIIFAGLSCGSIDPFLGFGQYSSLSMGVFAARAIAKGISYEKQIKPLIIHNRRLYNMRKAFNLMNNKDYDRILSVIKNPLVKNIFYNSPLDTSIFVSLYGKYYINKFKPLKLNIFEV